MANQQHSASAQILQFTGRSEGRFEEAGFSFEANQNALRDARMMKEASKAASNWMGTLLVALLSALDEKQRTTLELTLAGRDDEEAEQAMAFVRFANSGKDYQERVTNALVVMNGERRF